MDPMRLYYYSDTILLQLFEPVTTTFSLYSYVATGHKGTLFNMN